MVRCSPADGERAAAAAAGLPVQRRRGDTTRPRPPWGQQRRDPAAVDSGGGGEPKRAAAIDAGVHCYRSPHLFFFFLRIFLFFVFSQDNTVNTFTGRDLAACVLDSNQFRLQIRYFLFSLSNFLLSICFLSLPFMDKLYGVY